MPRGEYWRPRRGSIWHDFSMWTDNTPCVLGVDGPVYRLMSRCERHEFELDSRQADNYVPWTKRGKPKRLCQTCTAALRPPQEPDDGRGTT